MINNYKNYTVESVTSGHPDKICDQISDAVLDECLKQDPFSRVAVEVFGGHGLVVVGGEITSKAEVDFSGVAKKVYRDIGHNGEIKVISNVFKQSPDIAQGVDTGGAGDQGIMYGYATNETEQFLPVGVVLSHKLARQLEDARRSNKITWLKPDGKSQVTIENGKVKTVLVSTQHEDGIDNAEIRAAVIKNIIASVLGDISGVEILVNPTGKFVQGGFDADT